jgi:DNA repair protein RecO
MRQKSPLKSIYQQINEIQVNYTHNNRRQLQPIYDSKLLNGWNSINFDLKKTMLCLSMIEMIDRGFDEGDRDTETYYLLKNVLHYFDLEHDDYNNAFYFFVLHFLKNTGYNIIEAKEHPIVKRYLSKDQKLLQQLKEIYISNFLEEKDKKHIFNYNKKIVASFMSDLIRYHLPDIKSFAVAKEIFQ